NGASRSAAIEYRNDPHAPSSLTEDPPGATEPHRSIRPQRISAPSLYPNAILFCIGARPSPAGPRVTDPCRPPSPKIGGQGAGTDLLSDQVFPLLLSCPSCSIPK